MVDTYVFSEEVSMWSQHRVNVSNILHDFFYSPQVCILVAGLGAFPKTTGSWSNKSNQTKEEFVRNLHYKRNTKTYSREGKTFPQF